MDRQRDRQSETSILHPPPPLKFVGWGIINSLIRWATVKQRCDHLTMVLILKGIHGLKVMLSTDDIVMEEEIHTGLFNSCGVKVLSSN